MPDVEKIIGTETDPAGSGSGSVQPDVFPREVVTALRIENKERRLREKHLESLLRKVTELKESDDIEDSKIDAYIQSNKDLLNQAKKEFEDYKVTIENEKKAAKIGSAVKSLENQGWDVKLLDRLVDKSVLVLDDEGVPTNLLEVAEGLAKEFPALKSGVSMSKGGSNPPLGDVKKTELEEQLEKAIKDGNTALAVSLKRKMFEKK